VAEFAIPSYCTFGHQHSAACIERVRRADLAMQLCHHAGETARALEKKRAPRFAQLDLLALPVDQDVIDFWWSVHRACGVEYRRMSRIFWTRCPHGPTRSGQGNEP